MDLLEISGHLHKISISLWYNLLEPGKAAGASSRTWPEPPGGDAGEMPGM